MKIHEKLLNIQKSLVAPKGQYNNFGKFHYRSCEDIVEAAKPLLAKEKATLTLRDQVEEIGQKNYIKATAVLTDVETGEFVEVTAYARESQEKKGMDESQMTGTASSYARKYALNGLFAIDDTKDADTDEYKATAAKPTPKADASRQTKELSDKEVLDIITMAGDKGTNEAALKVMIKKRFHKDIEYITKKEAQSVINYYSK